MSVRANSMGKLTVAWLLAFCLLVSAQQTIAKPGPVPDAASGFSRADNAEQRKIKVWKVKQSNSWGLFTIYAAPGFLRVDGSTGGRLIAKAPDWQVFVFHTEDKRFCSVPYRQWGVGRVSDAFSVERSGVTPKPCNVAGIRAKKYTFRLNGEVDQQDGGIFRSTAREELVRSHVTVASDDHGLPKQLIEIWRRLLEIQCKNAIPLEVSDDKRFGGSNFSLRTQSQSAEAVPIKFFDCPVGFKSGGTPISVFFGSSMEDAASLMLDMK